MSSSLLRAQLHDMTRELARKDEEIERAARHFNKVNIMADKVVSRSRDMKSHNARRNSQRDAHIDEMEIAFHNLTVMKDELVSENADIEGKYAQLLKDHEALQDEHNEAILGNEALLCSHEELLSKYNKLKLFCDDFMDESSAINDAYASLVDEQ